MDLLQNKLFTCSVSSVLNKNIKSHGKQFLHDQEDDTAWYSDKGDEQFISIKFSEPQSIKAFEIQFQGGFSAKQIVLTSEDLDGTRIIQEQFWADDINAKQRFVLQNAFKAAHQIRINFKDSSDLFGRLIIYKLKLFA